MKKNLAALTRTALLTSIFVCWGGTTSAEKPASTPAPIIDSHVHLVGLGSDNSGCYLNPNQQSWLHPLNYLKTLYMIKAAGIGNNHHADQAYVEQLDRHILNFPGERPYYTLVFAFAPTYDRTSKTIDYAKTGIAVPNDYLLRVTANRPRMIPVGSLHPYQANLGEEMQRLHQAGVRLLKLLPNSMHFDPADPESETFFREAAAQKMVLITHVGDEHSVAGGGINNAYGNPLLYEAWLKKYPQLKIIFAHVGSEGKSPTAEGKKEDNFNLVLALLRRYPQQTYADISAFSVAFARARYLPHLLLASDIHDRLIYGSDYPLPSFGVVVGLTLSTLRWHKLISFRDIFTLLKIQRQNPFAYNYELLRRLSYQGKSFPETVFYQNFLAIFADRDLPSPLKGKTFTKIDDREIHSLPPLLEQASGENRAPNLNQSPKEGPD